MFLHETIFLHAFVHSGAKFDKTWRAAAHVPTSILVGVLAGGIHKLQYLHSYFVQLW